MAAPTLAAAGAYSSNGGAGNIGPQTPTGVVAGSLLLCVVYQEPSSGTTFPTITPPTGLGTWTLVAGYPLVQTNSGAIHRHLVYYKYATGTETSGAQYTFGAGSTWTEGVVVRIAGGPTSGDPVTEKNTAIATSLSTTSPVVIINPTSQADALLVHIRTTFNGGTWAVSSGFTAAYTPGADDIAVASKTQAVAGTTGNVTGTQVSDKALASLLAIYAPSSGTAATATAAITFSATVTAGFGTGATAAITFTGSGTFLNGGGASGAIDVTASVAAKATVSATASITFGATATAVALGASASITLSASVTAKASPTATAAITIVATGTAAGPTYQFYLDTDGGGVVFGYGNDNGGAISLAELFYTTLSGQYSYGVKFYLDVNTLVATTGYSAALYAVDVGGTGYATGPALATATGGTYSRGTWAEIDWPTTFPLVANTIYALVVFFPNSSYSAASGIHNSGFGDLAAETGASGLFSPGDTSGHHNGQFHYGASLVPTDGTFNSNGYGVNPLLTTVPSGSPATATAAITFSASLSSSAPIAPTAAVSLVATGSGAAPEAGSTAAVAVVATVAAKATASATAAFTIVATGSAGFGTGATAAISISASVTATAPATATAAMTFVATGTGAGIAPATATAAISVVATANAAAPEAANTAAISIVATGSAKGAGSVTAAIDITATGSAAGVQPATATAAIDVTATGIAHSPGGNGTGAITIVASTTAAVQATATASVAVVGTVTAAGIQPATAAAAVTITATASAKAPAVSTTASFDVSATVSARVTAGATAAVGIVGTVAVAAPVTATAAIALVATGFASFVTTATATAAITLSASFGVSIPASADAGITIVASGAQSGSPASPSAFFIIQMFTGVNPLTLLGPLTIGTVTYTNMQYSIGTGALTTPAFVSGTVTTTSPYGIGTHTSPDPYTAGTSVLVSG